MSKKEEKVSRWYFGGLAATGAVVITHPLDLIKVHMQTQKGKNISLASVSAKVFKTSGVLGFYNGISASLLRQLSYSTSRFGIYEMAKQHLTPDKDNTNIPFYMTALIAGIGGLVGGLVGNPADVINVRMQNDVKLPESQRRNYHNAVHGIWRVVTTEGLLGLWVGGTMNCSRAALMTIGQLAFYDVFKAFLISTPHFKDNVVTHVTSSLLAFGSLDFHNVDFDGKTNGSQSRTLVSATGKTCNFGATLEVNLRDQFVSGLHHEDMRSRLFAEPDLNYTRAVELALALEVADRHAATAAASGPAIEGIHRVGAAAARGPRRAPAPAPPAAGPGAPAQPSQPCPRCGKGGHSAAKCRYKAYNCDSCGERGHLKVMCRKYEGGHGSDSTRKTRGYYSNHYDATR